MHCQWDFLVSKLRISWSNFFWIADSPVTTNNYSQTQEKWMKDSWILQISAGSCSSQKVVESSWGKCPEFVCLYYCLTEWEQLQVMSLKDRDRDLCHLAMNFYLLLIFPKGKWKVVSWICNYRKKKKSKQTYKTPQNWVNGWQNSTWKSRLISANCMLREMELLVRMISSGLFVITLKWNFFFFGTCCRYRP